MNKKNRNPYIYILLATFWLIVILHSCQRCNHYYLLSDNNKKIKITQTNNNLTITKDGITLSYVKRHGEFINPKNNEVFLSTTQKILDKKSIESFYGDTIITKILHVYDYRRIKEFANKELYLCRKYIDGSKYGRDMEYYLSEIYYDKDFHIYAIITFDENHEYILGSSQPCPYKITHKKDTLVMFYKKKRIPGNIIYVNKEYIDEHNLFMSTHRDTTFTEKAPLFGSETSLVTRIYKTNSKQGGKNIYVSKFSARRDGTKREQLLRAYYYDDNYNIIKIVEPKMNIYKITNY